MATVQDRPFSKNYSGLINQSVIAAGLFVICVTSHEYMKRKRRGRGRHSRGELGSIESWQFGYLFQARSWARKASPPIVQGWPLSWVKQALRTPDHKLNELRGVDATLYVRFLQGCVWFTLAHTCTTFPILLPIHVTFSDADVSPKSMTRASISSLVSTSNGPSLLWIHLLLLIWVTFSWLATLHWITRGAFRYRAQKIREAAKVASARSAVDGEKEDKGYHPHPHPPYNFRAVPAVVTEQDRVTNRGIRARTVIVTDIPASLRSEKELKEYFEYYLSRPIAKPTMGVTSAARPGFIDRTLAFIFNRAVRLASRLHRSTNGGDVSSDETGTPTGLRTSVKAQTPRIEKVVLVRNMTELPSLLERREEILTNLETAHIKLARNALQAVAEHIESQSKTDRTRGVANVLSLGLTSPSIREPKDVERVVNDSEEGIAEADAQGEDRMQLVTRTLAPFLSISEPASPQWYKWKRGDKVMEMQSPMLSSQKSPALGSPTPGEDGTIWDALLSLPRSVLDAYQPLIRLSALFWDKTVPSIDYYTAKLNLLTSMITEARARSPSDYPPRSTAFVTFADPADARRACKYLAVHPSNPVNVCLVTMAPSYEDLDWKRLMKSTFRVEFVKDWVVNIGVWAFTILWIFPVSSIVAFVSIQTISAFWPGLRHYLDKHEWESEVIQSLVPTLLVAILTLLVPLILLLIAKKAHTIGTLSVMHDRILTRYYKFLIVNVLVFFCVGAVTVQAALTLKAASRQVLIQLVSESFPTAAPFYVGWLIFNTAVHGCLELALFGLPLILYPRTKRQETPRKRAVGIRPRTFNYYYWLPNHLLVIHILLLFAVLNPLVIPFGCIYFGVETVVIKNQFLHVYAKNYEGNGQSLLIRLVRYSLDGLILAQTVFLAYMVVLKRKANVGVSAVLIILTVFAKLSLTRFYRARFERDDGLEARVLCGHTVDVSVLGAETPDTRTTEQEVGFIESKNRASMTRISFFTWKLASRVGLSYGTLARRRHRNRPPIPFGDRGSADSVLPLHACSSTSGLLRKEAPHAELTLPIFGDQPIVEEPDEISPLYSDGYVSGPLIIPHPPLPAWDDESDPDTPYDNPYYTRQISNSLWLPRDPLAILDLDDTVDMRISLTSDSSAGKLGIWREDLIGSALSSALAGSLSSLDETNEGSSALPRTLDGTETINLPPTIASRVQHIDREHEVESTSSRKPSLLVPRKLSTSSTGRAITLRRQIADSPMAPGFRSFSLGATTEASLLRAEISHLPVPDGHRRQRSASVGLLALQRPASSGASTPTRPSPLPGDGSIAPRSVISTREAVVGEAIAEEHEAAQQRQRQEEAEEEKAKEPRSWLTSWMFSKDH